MRRFTIASLLALLAALLVLAPPASSNAAFAWGIRVLAAVATWIIAEGAFAGTDNVWRSAAIGAGWILAIALLVAFMEGNWCEAGCEQDRTAIAPNERIRIAAWTVAVLGIPMILAALRHAFVITRNVRNT